MSTVELKEQIAELPADDRLKLAAYLAELDERDDPHIRQVLIQRMESMDKGEKVSVGAFEKTHIELKRQGR